ncbi:hypothetical protein FA95DRAFT_1286192 [Auriscalpium vulgare]|uniref:Uncharacterized protein n=1 Tax=Auriscalpium vulgare TaxID=40419 RepID=A0ACB8R325_9AGAM|nr:hypothetical protein FA95DRAFT_1286192 [Auriscalpium vulgare]
MRGRVGQQQRGSGATPPRRVGVTCARTTLPLSRTSKQHSGAARRSATRTDAHVRPRCVSWTCCSGQWEKPGATTARGDSLDKACATRTLACVCRQWESQTRRRAARDASRSRVRTVHGTRSSFICGRCGRDVDRQASAGRDRAQHRAHREHRQ